MSCSSREPGIPSPVFKLDSGSSPQNGLLKVHLFVLGKGTHLNVIEELFVLRLLLRGPGPSSVSTSASHGGGGGGGGGGTTREPSR